MHLSLVHPDVINHVRLLHHLLPIISGGPEFPPDEEYYLKIHHHHHHYHNHHDRGDLFHLFCLEFCAQGAGGSQ